MNRHHRKLLLASLLLAVTAIFIAFCLLHLNSKPTVDVCKANMKKIATAIEQYASDNSGHFPTELSKLTKSHYLREIPTCPAAENDTYSVTFRESETGYSFGCKGGNHTRPSGANRPHYMFETGPVYPWYDSEASLQYIP